VGLRISSSKQFKITPKFIPTVAHSFQMPSRFVFSPLSSTYSITSPSLTLGASQPVCRFSTSTNKHVFDVTNDTFEKEVLNSKVPVIVDCHAHWCPPCRVLGPKLEKLVQDTNGAVVMAKIDTDQNQELAEKHNISSIPAVFAYHKGKIVGSFVGLLNDKSLKEFVDKVKESK